MTIRERLNGICEMIAHEHAENNDSELTWEVASDWQAVIHTPDGQVVLSWIQSGDHAGEIEVELSGNTTVHPGDVRLMYVNAAMWPQGDFQVAETIGDLL